MWPPSNKGTEKEKAKKLPPKLYKRQITTKSVTWGVNFYILQCVKYQLII